jgi:crotonobetainyl-CoA:carnitine CoA-transferase CaiB-like acyl-CoA transferase
VLVENFRPGTLERLGLGPDVLHERNPKLVITRVSGFGQTGPYAQRPGFATLAEAMSGFAAINGEPDGPPLLPPIALTDEITAMAAAFATMVAIHSGVGQVVDVSLLESMLQVMGALPSAYALLGYLQPRLGAGIPYTIPRSTYRTADGKWIAVSTSSEPVAHRLLELVGIGADERFATSHDRAEHRAEIDEAVATWVGTHSVEDVLAGLVAADVAAAPVMDMADLAADPHVKARGILVEVDGVQMQNVVARLSATPGRVRWAGRPPGADDAEVFGRDG